ncbi:MAG TPA: hypothetical protein PL182_02980 [Pseudobdellovibrionaceae bacterium]|nr:hypothetical protein [Pseudobdellovibrionaceae bacterium]
MKTNLFLLFLFVGVFAKAEIKPCEDWPQVVSQSGPSMAVTDYPFNLNIRFSCVLEKRFMIEGLQGVYHAGRLLQIPPYLALVTHPLPDGDRLYQFFHVIPRWQRPGMYKLEGCVMIRDLRAGGGRCLPVSHSLEVVGDVFH